MGSALAQIKEKKYYEKYLSFPVDDGHTYHQRGTNHKQADKIKEIYLIGVEFSKLERNITNFEWEKIL